MHRLSVTSLVLILLAVLSLLPRPAAFAQDDVAAAKTKLLESITFTSEEERRARAVTTLAAFDGLEAATTLTECLERLGARMADAETDLARQLVEYQPYAGFTQKDKKDWQKKKKLRQKIDRTTGVLAGDHVVMDAFVAAFAGFRDAEALEKLTFAGKTTSSPHARRALLGGLLRNTALEPLPLATAAMKDASPTVRLFALEGMAERKSKELVPLAITALREPGWPHRQAAINALRALADIRSVGPLVAAMTIEDGRLVDAYGTALAEITGETLGPNPLAWKQWYDDHADEYEAQGVERVRAKKPKKRKGPTPNYYGIETRSHRIVFIIDVSGSMKEPIGKAPARVITGEDDRKQGHSGPKIEVAKKTLAQAIEKLPKDAYFAIIVFNHSVRWFKEKMLPATGGNKKAAQAFIRELQPAGATFTYGALERAFQYAGTGATDKHYDPAVDQIFLLSDGAPTDDDSRKAKPMKGKKILEAVSQWNRLSKLQIHTIAIDPAVGKGAFIKFMKSLAKENHGTYTEIGQ